ncbi:glucose dehydrogenase [Conexibacter sp. W3-3-2]|uniref:PQQ-dependent sugar dehydrogenase n=1 Tax=Conexibacter sp. W3-3-2 TaxID=2675227 RepID=UPI0012B965AC|nr:PQQ-dependent sugar dehydrogenase [Conexibacter sp. W3-3-2]MTD44235.1 glucose dehydrogenase [Conexibacter sp. W3-3-2]
MSRRPLLLLTLGLLAPALAACGADDDTATVASSTPTSAMQDAAPAATTGSGAAAAQATGVQLRRVGSFTQPLYVTGAPGDRRRLFVVEQGGRIMVVRGGRKLAVPFLDIRSLVTAGGEQGLLSVAFPPDYARTGRFYVYYTDKAAKQRVVEYRRATADRADRSSARLVLRMDDPESNHNGGLMKFGPDGLLYIATGDGGGAGDEHGSRGNAQDLGSLLGKLLRIDPRRTGSRAYRVPSSNPFVGRSGARREIFSYGLRNPWRFSFDRSTGDLVIGDVGQGEIEEVDFVQRRDGRAAGAGANFGWRPFEGSRVFRQGESAPGHVKPVIEHSHDDGWCSITGGYVVRDPALTALRGRYVYSDFCKGEIYAGELKASGSTSRRVAGLPKVEGLASFGEDTAGRVYVVSLNGTVSRLAAK